MPELIVPTTAVHASFVAAMDEFAAEGRGSLADDSMVGRDIRERAAVAHIRGYAPGESDQLVNDYLRVTRRARAVVERVFWG
jgi:hypothetical protein